MKIAPEPTLNPSGIPADSVEALPVTDVLRIRSELGSEDHATAGSEDEISVIATEAPPPKVIKSVSFLQSVFQRKLTLSDIVRQTECHDLHIQMDADDNLMAKISPKISKLLAKVYLSKLFLFALAAVLAIGKFTEHFWCGMLFMVGMVSIVNVGLLKFMLTHSFEVCAFIKYPNYPFAFPLYDDWNPNVCTAIFPGAQRHRVFCL